jgi:hypothetical protein
MVNEPPLHSSNEWEHILPWCTTLQDLERNYLVLCMFVFKINISRTFGGSS